MKKSRLLGVVYACVIPIGLIITGTANATTTQYGDFAAWSSNSTNVTTLDFNSYTSVVSHGDSYTIGGVTFKAIGGAVYGLPAGLGGPHHTTGWLTQEKGAWSIDFASPITSLSFDFGAYFSADIELTLTTNMGEVFIANADADSYAFGGFTTDVQFSSVTLSVDVVEAFGPFIGYDNFSYGLASVVPIPPAVWLFGTGLMGLIGVSRRK